MKYRKKSVVVEAIQWNGENAREIMDWSWGFSGMWEEFSNINSTLIISTVKVRMTADIGDWIIKGAKGELYPCKPDIFEMTYEKVEELK